MIEVEASFGSVKREQLRSRVEIDFHLGEMLGMLRFASQFIIVND